MLSSKSTKRADILTLIEGNLQIARNVVIILEEETSQPPRNQSGTVHAPFFSWVRLTFLVRSCKTSTKDDRCFVEKEGDCVLLATAVHKRASDICIVWTCSKLLLQTCMPTFTPMPFLPVLDVPFLRRKS